MSAWTTVTYDHIDTGEVILQYGVTKDNLKYVVCKSGWWEYVVEIGKSYISSDIFSVLKTSYVIL